MINPKVFNQKVGKVLRVNRERLSLSPEQVRSKVKHVSLKELKDIEDGKISPRGYQLYELLMLYKPTEDETMFFCTNPRYHSKVLSKSFLEAYELH